ncbi:MAG: hypothetical protein JWM53_707 [bacterium]|nr:hypothetical protein [bacterium]
MKRLLVMSALLLSGAAGSEEPGAPLVRAPADALRVTRGAIEAIGGGRVRVREPKMRAVVPWSDGDDAELRFTYAGPSDGAAPLASGEMRRQIGIKLRAADGCNLLYVMWRIEPKAQIVVSLKRNPGQSTHRQCGARGYRNLVARAGTQPAPLAAGDEHRLHARLDGRILRVWADRALAWEGDVGDEAAALRGPAGVRSDNGRFELELLARPSARSPVIPLSDDED